MAAGAAVAFVVALAASPAGPVAPVAAAAAPQHRAAVVVDTGTEVRRVCVRFSEDFISGAELLIRASTDPVFRDYSGKGKAVCSLCGVGCPPDESCLTCGGDTYWTYGRAPKGSNRFSLSGGGASSTRVRDGDVDGWRWSKGLVPAYASIEQICGPETSTTTTGGSGTATGGSGGGGSASGGTTTTTSGRETTRGGGGDDGGTTVVGSGTSTSLPAGAGADGSTSTSTTTGPTEDEYGEAASAPATRRPTNDGGPSPALLLFPLLLGGLLAWGLRLSRRRRGRSTDPAPLPPPP